jgi:hypothetical protein
MPVFAAPADADAIFVPFLSEITSDPNLKEKFIAANTSFKIVFVDPEASYLVDCTSDPISVVSGEIALHGDAAVELTMSADDGHKFWLGDLNLMGALARRKVKPKGEVTKLMGLLPTLQKAYPIYRGYATKNGLV